MSPLHQTGERALSAHMAEHELLMLVAAPLLVLAEPLAVMLWVWHSPSLFERALEWNGWHIAQHLSFLLSALLFWTAMLGLAGAYGEDSHQTRLRAEAITHGDVARGKAAISQAGCTTCHHIPGVRVGDGAVGPALTGFASRATIAGVLPNDPANLILWLQHAQQVLPRNAMPDMGLSERQARDIGAFVHAALKRYLRSGARPETSAADVLSPTTWQE